LSESGGEGAVAPELQLLPPSLVLRDSTTAL
jgi:hypothetical protein